MGLKRLLKVSFLMLFAIGSSAQPQKRPVCKADEHRAHLAATLPNFEREQAAIETEAASWRAQQNSKSLLTIPVVVHVIYRTPVQNISVEQIESQIRVLNEDFNRLNPDRTKTPSTFESIAADCEINFCLARIDPDGNPTTGITRTQTTVQNIGQQNGTEYYQTSAGGHDIWDRNSYLNIWVCEVPGLTLGFASPPTISGAANDGVVIGYQYFGTTGTATAPQNLGRTTTHEVGHWLGLQHLWGLGDPSGTNCDIDDGISDTPNQEQANYFCPAFPHFSCAGEPQGDVFMNYMDYVDDDCMNLFTEEQKARMTAILNSNPRNNLFNSTAECSFTGIPKLRERPLLINIYPNPARNRFTIEFIIEKRQPTTIRIINTLGETVYSQYDIPFTAKKVKIEPDLPDGIYFLEAVSGDLRGKKTLLIQ